MSNKHILVADDDASVRELLAMTLGSHGYSVLTATNGYQLVQMAQATLPDLLIIDLMMPQLDGYEAIRQLRNDTRTSHIPMLILTAKSTANDVVMGFEIGADDYITKPFNTSELLARVKSHLRRAAQRPVNNPLTGLAGNILLAEELKYRIKQNTAFALLYIDLDNFKAFNDTYGFLRGDHMIRLLADVLSESLANCGGGHDFLGHIGGDDFAIVTLPGVLEQLCKAIIGSFDERVVQLYDVDDLKRGYLRGTDRHGIQRQFPITSISIGVVTNVYRTFSDYEEVSRVATEMKQFAKTKSGSVYEVDERGACPTPVVEDRRGILVPTVLLISVDTTLLERLAAMVDAHGYRSIAAASVIEAHALLAHEEAPPALIAADAALGKLLWDLCTDMRRSVPELPLLAFTMTHEPHEPPEIPQATVCLQQPFTDDTFIGLVIELLSHLEVPD